MARNRGIGVAWLERLVRANASIVSFCKMISLLYYDNQHVAKSESAIAGSFESVQADKCKLKVLFIANWCAQTNIRKDKW